MTEEMEKNIISENNIQYFTDITYYALTPKPCKYKILILLAFNSKEFKSILCNITLIANENKETLITVYEYLKIKYQWNPSIISRDFSKSELKSLKYVCKNITIVPCFFHFISNITKHLKQLKSKNSKEKNIAKDLLANIKLLVFLPIENIKDFFKLI